VPAARRHADHAHARQLPQLRGHPADAHAAPAYLLRDPSKKKLAWEDLKAVNAALARVGIHPPRPPRIARLTARSRSRRASRVDENHVPCGAHGPSQVVACLRRWPRLRFGREAGRCYKTGVDKFEADDMDGAVQSLQAFVDKSCGSVNPDKRCRDAYIKLGHAYERLGGPARAWTAYDAALGFPPHTRDAAVQADVERTQRQMVERRQRNGVQAPVVLLYRDEVSDEFNARSVVISIDFEPVVSKDKDASDLHKAEYQRVYGGSVEPGDHVLTIDAVHDCKPGSGGRCARSKLRKSFPFTSAPHAPTTIEIRAFAEDGAGDAPRTRRSSSRRASGPRGAGAGQRSAAQLGSASCC
jgi:hypothetical protein